MTHNFLSTPDTEDFFLTMWFKLPPTTLQAKDTGVITSQGTILQIQTKETAPSLTAVNVEQEAQNFMLPKALPKAMGNTAIANRFPHLLLSDAYSLAYGNPEPHRHSSPLPFSNATIIQRQQHCLRPTWEEGRNVVSSELLECAVPY